VQDRLAVAAEALHAQRRDVALAALAQHLPLEAAGGAVEGVQRHLYAIPLVAQPKHAQVDRRVLVAGETDKARVGEQSPFQAGCWENERKEDLSAGLDALARGRIRS
jgi:hypothetical protein